MGAALWRKTLTGLDRTHVELNYHNIPHIGTHELYKTLSVLKLHDVFNNYMLKFIRFEINDRAK